MKMTNDILRAIVNGDMDDQLDTLGRAIQTRRGALRGLVAGSLKEGDTVKITGAISPKYMQGKEVEVIKVNRKRAVVKTFRQVGKFLPGTRFTVPLTCVEKVE